MLVNTKEGTLVITVNGVDYGTVAKDKIIKSGMYIALSSNGAHQQKFVLCEVKAKDI